MLLEVIFDLADADLSLFDAYEDAVLPLLARHGGELLSRTRAPDNRTEVHVISFPDAQAFERYRNDPDRLAAAPLQARSGAKASLREINGSRDP